MTNLISKEIGRLSGIYKIVNKINGKIYIGSTQTLTIRYNSHHGKLRNNKHVNDKLQRSVNKYGLDNFYYDLIEIVNDLSLLVEREQYYIDTINPYYNIYKKAKSDDYKNKREQSVRNSDDLKRRKCINCATSKLNEEQVIHIISLINKGEACNSISKQFNITHRSVTDIKNKTSYKHLSHLLNDNLRKDWSPLTTEDVIKIIERINSKERDEYIAKDYNVTPTCIRYIRTKKRWKKLSHLLK